jgi:hypothetical protein
MLCHHLARTVPRGHCQHHKQGNSLGAIDNSKKRAFIYCPGVHEEHADAAIPANLPGAHAVHTAAPDCDCVFRLQSRQVLPAGAYLPATQLLHVVASDPELLHASHTEQVTYPC